MYIYICVQILLHDPKEEPLMIERGLNVSPGFSTQIAVTAQYVSDRKATLIKLKDTHRVQAHADQLLSISALHCWLGHLTRKIRPRYDL